MPLLVLDVEVLLFYSGLGKEDCLAIVNDGLIQTVFNGFFLIEKLELFLESHCARQAMVPI